MEKPKLKLSTALFIRILLVACVLTPILGFTLYRIISDNLTDAFVDATRASLFEYAQLLELQSDGNYSELEIQQFLENLLIHADILDIHLEQPAQNKFIQSEFSSGLSRQLPEDAGVFENGDSYYVQSVPININGEFSTLRGVFSEENLRQQLLKATLLGSGFLIAFTAIMLVISFRQFRQIAAVANKLKLNSEKIAEGIEGVALGVESDIEEFWGLSQALDKMHAEMREQQRALELQVVEDPLTEIGNRLYFNQELSEVLGNLKRQQKPFAVILLDIDDFKNINDSYGHPLGDRLICFNARVLDRIARSIEGKAARMGGDEFALIFPLKSPESFNTITESILKKLKRTVYLSKRNIGLSICIGGVIVESADISDDEIVKRADVALYAAKHNKRTPIRLFDDLLFLAENRREAILDSLKSQDYLNPGSGFSFRFQPKFSLKDKALVGFEALVFWQHPELGYLTPDEFIPLAEQQGLVAALSKHIIERCCEIIAGWNKKSEVAVSVAINISPLDLKNPFFVPQLLESFQAYEIPLQSIELEVTEHVLVDDYHTAIETLGALGDAGISIAIDDFGVGYSNFANLNKLPIKTIKIDRNFVQDCIHGNEQFHIIGAIVGLAKKLGLTSIAEGVDSESNANLLAALGCEFGQGEWMHPYLTEPEVLSFWLAEGPATAAVVKPTLASISTTAKTH